MERFDELTLVDAVGSLTDALIRLRTAAVAGEKAFEQRQKELKRRVSAISQQRDHLLRRAEQCGFKSAELVEKARQQSDEYGDPPDPKSPAAVFVEDLTLAELTGSDI